MRSGELDVAAVFDLPALGLTVDSGLEARHLLDEAHDVLLPPGHLLASRRKVTIADLRDDYWLMRMAGWDTVGEIVDYDGVVLLCYLRGPDGLIFELAEQLR